MLRIVFSFVSKIKAMVTYENKTYNYQLKCNLKCQLDIYCIINLYKEVVIREAHPYLLVWDKWD